MKFFTLIILLLLANNSFSQCPPILDQSHVTTSSGSNATDHWQSFTAGSTGDLSKISVYSNGGINTTLTLGIYSGTGIGGTLLYTENKSFNLTGVSIELIWNINCSTIPSVTTGSAYTIRIQGNLNTKYNASNPYASGHYFNSTLGLQTGSDMNFKTYVSNSNKPVASITPTNILCNGGNDGSVTSSVVSGTPTYNFSWSSGEGTANITGKTAGTYSLTVTDNNTCISCPVSTTLTEPPAIIVNAGIDQTICFEDSALINATSTGATTYSWSSTIGLSSPNSLTTKASPTGTAIYTLTATDAFGCYITDDITINVNPLPTVIAPSNFQTCDGNSANLTATGTATSYLWDNGIFNNVNFTPGIGSVDYIVTGQDANNCINKDTVNITVFANPNVTLSGIPNICDNELSYAFSEGLPTGGTYSGTGISANILDPSLASIGLNNITYFYVDGNGCSATNNQNITVYSAPTITSPVNLTKCEGEEIVLIGSGADTYVWDNGVTDSSPFTPSLGNTLYTVTGTDVNGCQGTSQTTVIVNSLPLLIVSSDQIFCLGDDINLTASGASNYNWESGGGTNDIYGVVPTETIVINVIGTTLGCTTEKNITLTLDDPNNISAGDNQSICTGFGTNLEANGGSEYSWSGPNNFSSDSQNIYITVDSSFYYSVKVTTDQGCIYTDSVLISVLIDPSCTVSFSNTISPNHDGVNDFWTIEGIESFEENLVVIYNRWGDVVFEENNYDNGAIKWEGTNSLGNDAIPGTYFYRIELTNGPTYSGWIELMR